MRQESWKLTEPKVPKYFNNRINERNEHTINLYLKFELFQIKFFCKNFDLKCISYQLKINIYEEPY